jgi:hypothetical protein
MGQGIIAVGDSITSGCSPDLVVDAVPARSWAQWVAEATGQPLTVHAQPGASSSQIRALLPETLADYSLGLVHVGANNVTSWRAWRRDDLGSDLRAILSRLARHCDRVAVLQIPATLGRGRAALPYGPMLGSRVVKVRRAVDEAAADCGAVLVEPPRLTGGRVWIDGVHPTSSGHLALAQSTLTALGLPPVDEHGQAAQRPDFDAWRRRKTVHFMLRQPVRGVGGWLLA